MLNYESLTAAIRALPKPQPKPSMYVMNWHTWVQVRHEMRKRGYRIRYVRLGRRLRMLENVPVIINDEIPFDQIILSYFPVPKFLEVRLQEDDPIWWQFKTSWKIDILTFTPPSAADSDRRG
jgi:hypothetical protein